MFKVRKIKIGDKLQIHCYKHDGSIRRINDEATVLDIKDDMIVCGNYKTRIYEFDDDGKSYHYYTKEPAILFFYKNDWYNVISQIKPSGLYYYCNIASPYIIDDEVIKYIDYDLDLRVFPDGAFKVLDRNEYRYHKKVMNYPEEIEKIIQHELTNLIETKKKGERAFQREVVEYYVKLYEDMRNKR